MIYFLDSATGVVVSFESMGDALDAVADRPVASECSIIDTNIGKFWSYDYDTTLIESGIIHNKS